MNHLILVRHGQSDWNLQKRFTGWVDVDLTPDGKLEACKAGELIKDLNLDINFFFSSYQKKQKDSNTKLKNGESILGRQVAYISEYLGVNNIIAIVNYIIS